MRYYPAFGVGWDLVRNMDVASPGHRA